MALDSNLVVPKHIAIVMDGNGRWAKKRLLPRTAGHAVGGDNLKKIARYCKKIGVDYLTVYAFSTENWKRPQDEVDAIMDIGEKLIYDVLKEMDETHTRLKVLGADTEKFSDKMRDLINRAHEQSKKYDGFQVNVCLNYGGRDEIVRAARAFADDVVQGKCDPDSLTEDMFSNYLYSAGIPEPELMIRPGGEHRLSNFLLWQCAYSEFYYCDTFWPDFDENELDNAIIEYNRRTRRFGNI